MAGAWVQSWLGNYRILQASQHGHERKEKREKFFKKTSHGVPYQKQLSANTRMTKRLAHVHRTHASKRERKREHGPGLE